MVHFKNENLQDLRWFRDRLRSRGLLMGAAAVRTHASRISSSPVSYISESVVSPPRDDPKDRASKNSTETTVGYLLIPQTGHISL